MIVTVLMIAGQEMSLLVPLGHPQDSEKPAFVLQKECDEFAKQAEVELKGEDVVRVFCVYVPKEQGV